jgi:hypothetical protein
MAKFDPLLACANTLFLQARPHFFFDTVLGWSNPDLNFRRHYVSISLSLSPYSTRHSLIPVLCIGIRRPLRCTCPHMPTTVVRSTIRARCHTPPLIQRCHHVWHTTGVSDGGCKPARHMWMVLWLTVPYRHCQLPEQCGVTLVTSDSTMTDCPNHRLWHIMVQCHRPPMSHHTSMSTHSLPYIGMSSDWPQKPREEDMPLTWSQQVQIQTLILGCRWFSY